MSGPLTMGEPNQESFSATDGLVFQCVPEEDQSI